MELLDLVLVTIATFGAKINDLFISIPSGPRSMICLFQYMKTAIIASTSITLLDETPKIMNQN